MPTATETRPIRKPAESAGSRNSGAAPESGPPYRPGVPAEGDAIAPETALCARCGAPSSGPLAYWGDRHCGPCVALVVAELDEANSWPRAPWEVTPHRAALVLGGDGTRFEAWGPGGVWYAPAVPANLGALGALAEQRGAAEVWVHPTAFDLLGWPSTFSRLGGPTVGHPHRFFDELGGYECRLDPAGLCAWTYYYRKGGHAFDLHVPAYGRFAPKPFASPFHEDAQHRPVCDNAAELFWAVSHYYEATAGRVRWCGTGAITSDNLLRAQFRRRTRERGGLVATAVAPPFAEGIAPEHDARWVRQPTGKELGARYLVAFDANAHYLAAASSIALPAGELAHRELGAIELRENVPGYWLLDTENLELGCAGPVPWRTADQAGTPAVWVTTPSAWLAAKTYGVEPIEAWVWPEHHAYLRRWYETLRDARAAADIGGPALRAVKSIYKAGLGRLASTTRTAGAADPLYQPYWDQAVTAQARCNLHRRLVKLRAEPVAIDVDCLFFLTSSPNPAAFAARIGLPLGPGLGEYEPYGLRARGADARDVLDPANLVGSLRKLRELVKGRPE